MRGSFVSLQSVNYPTHYLRHRGFMGYLAPVTSSLDRSDATFRIVPGLAGGDSLYRYDSSFRVKPGLADRTKVSLESVNYPGYYLRHRGFQFYIEQGSGELYNLDCTFSVVEPLAR